MEIEVLKKKRQERVWEKDDTARAREETRIAAGDTKSETMNRSLLEESSTTMNDGRIMDPRTKV